MRKISFIMLLLSCFAAQAALPHCQIPCGIYDDAMRFDMIKEDIETIEKSMNEIVRLSAEDVKDYNQIVRWIDNKEFHADRIIETVTDYFLAQRIKPAEVYEGEEYAKYLHKLSLLHELVYYSMKSKQTVELENVTRLRGLLEDFKAAY